MILIKRNAHMDLDSILLPSLELRMIENGDWSAIEKIQFECYPAAVLESRQVLQSKCAHSNSSCYVAISETKVVGYCLAHLWINKSPPPLHHELQKPLCKSTTLYIHDIAVTPNAQNQGIALAILAQLKVTASAMNLKTLALTSVPEAVSYWQRNGFISINIEEDIDQYGKGSQYMQLNLSI